MINKSHVAKILNSETDLKDLAYR